MYKDNHSRSTEGRFIVPLPKKPDAKPLGESRAQAVQRFHSLERVLHSRGLFGEVETVMEEYFQMGHAEVVPPIYRHGEASSALVLPSHAHHAQGVKHYNQSKGSFRRLSEDLNRSLLLIPRTCCVVLACSLDDQAMILARQY